jgi:outer membrane murein-binding lipoprotein Lpp
MRWLRFQEEKYENDQCFLRQAIYTRKLMSGCVNQKKENKRKSEANDVSQMQTSSEPTF